MTAHAETRRQYRDLAYVDNGHEQQKLDLYLPEGVQHPPLIVYIHGGAFWAGDKSSELMPKRYLDKGYAIASLNYRFSQHAIFPAQIEDCKAAVRWLRAHATQYGYDSGHFIAWGESAGGHLAAMLGTTGNTKQFDVGANLQFSSGVQGVVDYYGPTDFLQMDAHRVEGGETHNQASSPASHLVGGPIQERPIQVKEANPLTYISRPCPPFFVAHGTRDRIVPPHQSEILVDALKKAAVPVTFLSVEGTDHGFGGASKAQWQELDSETDKFIAALRTSSHEAAPNQ